MAEPNTDTPGDTRNDDGENTPIGLGWTLATYIIGVFAALIAVGGMILSFRAVSAEMIPAFGAYWAWLVPVVVDFTVLAFSGVDLVLTRHGIAHPIPRFTVYAATTGTIWLNYAAGGNVAGRVAHILMPLVWVLFTETIRHVVRHKAQLVGVSLRQPIPAARWLLSPWATAKLWRRMILWQVNSYPTALAHERERLRKIAGFREKHGRLLWRFYVTPLEKLELSLGPAGTLRPAPATESQGASGPGLTGGCETVPPPVPQDVPTQPTGPVPGPGEGPSHEILPRQAAARTTRSRKTTAKRTGTSVTSITPNPEWPRMAKEIVAAKGPNVPLAALQLALGCSKSSAGRLRADAITALAAKPAGEADTEPEREQVAS